MPLPSATTRPISERRTELSSGRDIARRLLFLFVILGSAGGALAVVFGLSKSRLPLAIVGALVLLVVIVTWWRTRAAIAATSAEIKENPFKPKREPEE